MNEMNLQVRAVKNGFLIYEPSILNGGCSRGREWVAKDETELGQLIAKLATEFKQNGRFL